MAERLGYQVAVLGFGGGLLALTGAEEQTRDVSRSHLRRVGEA
jgi:hypothetical protein